MRLYTPFERSVTAPVYSDEHIEFWGEVYLANRWIGARGVLFENFLAYPVQILYALGALAEDCRHMLLGAQQRVREQIDFSAQIERVPAIARGIAAAEHAGARCENGRFVEKLRHHSHARADVHFRGQS